MPRLARSASCVTPSAAWAEPGRREVDQLLHEVCGDEYLRVRGGHPDSWRCVVCRQLILPVGAAGRRGGRPLGPRGGPPGGNPHYARRFRRFTKRTAPLRERRPAFLWRGRAFQKQVKTLRIVGVGSQDRIPARREHVL